MRFVPLDPRLRSREAEPYLMQVHTDVLVVFDQEAAQSMDDAHSPTMHRPVLKMFCSRFVSPPADDDWLSLSDALACVNKLRSDTLCYHVLPQEEMKLRSTSSRAGRCRFRNAVRTQRATCGRNLMISIWKTKSRQVFLVSLPVWHTFAIYWS